MKHSDVKMNNEEELVKKLLPIVESIQKARFDAMLYLLVKCAAKVCDTRADMASWLGLDMLRMHYFCDKWGIKRTW